MSSEAQVEFYQRADYVSTVIIFILFPLMLIAPVWLLKRNNEGKSSPIVASLLGMAWISYGLLLCGALWNDEDWLRKTFIPLFPGLAEKHVENQFDTACAFRGDFVDELKNGNFFIFLWKNTEGYVLSHFLGWWFVTAFFLRDGFGAFSLSLMHEILELWWERFYPPFRECWWDHCILDLGCNFFGVFFGVLTYRLLGLEPLNIMTKKAFTTANGAWYMLAMFIEEVIRFPLIFFVPHVLGIPPKHVINVFRFFAFKCSMLKLTTWSVKKRLENPKSYYMGFRWDRILLCILMLENLIVIKYHEGKFLDGTDHKVKVGFGVTPRGDQPMFVFATHSILVLLLIGVEWILINRLFYNQPDSEQQQSKGLLADLVSCFWISPPEANKNGKNLTNMESNKKND